MGSLSAAWKLSDKFVELYGGYREFCSCMEYLVQEFQDHKVVYQLVNWRSIGGQLEVYTGINSGVCLIF